MHLIQSPEYFFNIISNSEYAAPVQQLNRSISDILRDNKMPFFPAFTDHGIDHVEQVLKTEFRLIPQNVINSNLLTPADVAILSSATFLHDIAMHLTSDSFLRLIDGSSSPYKPIPWFAENYEELSWVKEWDNFLKEAKRFSDRELCMLFGPNDLYRDNLARIRNLPNDPSEWNKYDNLLVGEFIRRHHHRIAHEIAIYGLPGVELFPILSESLPDLADLIGTVARSHGISIRRAAQYLHFKHSDNLRPHNSVPFFHMALLRISDYLQIDSHRAPPVLLQLKNPQSPVSLSEWYKHKAVRDLSFSHKDPQAIYIQISSEISLTTNLQLRELIDALQMELDYSNAILCEVYGRAESEKLNNLILSKSRVCSNIQSKDLNKQLPYVPERIMLQVHPNILFLLVEPLYGKNPSIGIRELLQNSIDAVREKVQCCVNLKINPLDLKFRNEVWDVLIEINQKQDSSWELLLIDNGVGMDLLTIQKYLLNAGASFRDSPDWRKDFVNDEGKSIIARSGRFGIGIFAAFLLGKGIEIETRHIQDKTGKGFNFRVTNSANLIAIKQKKMPFGTMIRIPLEKEAANALISAAIQEGHKYPSEDEQDDEYREEYDDANDDYEDQEDISNIGTLDSQSWDWYTFDFPKVGRYIHFYGKQKMGLKQQIKEPSELEKELPPYWHEFNPPGFQAIRWIYEEYPSITCNGIIISNKRVFKWRKFELTRNISWPRICVIDQDSNLPLNLARTTVTRQHLDFEQDLVNDIILDFIAYSIVLAPSLPIWSDINNTDDYSISYPLDKAIEIGVKNLVAYSSIRFREFGWICDKDGASPLHRSILAQQKTTNLLLFGSPGFNLWDPHLTVFRNYIGIPTLVNTTEIPECLRFFAGLVSMGSTVLFGKIKGVRVYIFSNMENILLSSTCWNMSKPIFKFNSRYVHEYRFGSYYTSGIKIDYQKVIKNTFRKGLNAFVGEVFIEKTIQAKEEKDWGDFTRMWAKYIGKDFIPFDRSKRDSLIKECMNDKALGGYIEKWQEIAQHGYYYSVPEVLRT